VTVNNSHSIVCYWKWMIFKFCIFLMVSWI
jgi:hypothetical protein